MCARSFVHMYVSMPCQRQGHGSRDGSYGVVTFIVLLSDVCLIHTKGVENSTLGITFMVQIGSELKKRELSLIKIGTCKCT